MAEPFSPTGYWAHFEGGLALPVVDFEFNDFTERSYARICSEGGALFVARERRGFINVTPFPGR